MQVEFVIFLVWRKSELRSSSKRAMTPAGHSLKLMQ